MTTLDVQNQVKQNVEFVFKPKDPMSALTHLIGFLLAIVGMPILLIKASQKTHTLIEMISYGVFMLSMILLYGASTSYHSFYSSEKGNRILKKIDHISIFYLIAGSYTPICLSVLPQKTGILLFIIIWAIALCGTFFKAFFVYCPKWVSSMIYTGMGWAALSVFPSLYQSLSLIPFLFLLFGGIFYTIGAIIYALKPNLFHNEYFGNHELFHCFVLLGSLCHYLLVLCFIV